MNPKIDEMWNIGLYKAAAQSLIDNVWIKIVLASLLNLLTVPVDYIVALPIFWLLDFWAGTSYARRVAKKQGRTKWFKPEKMRKQFGKITLHLGALIGIVIISNLYKMPGLITAGFYYIIVNEFLFSTLPKFLGREKTSKLVKHIKDSLLMHFGLDAVFNAHESNGSQPPEDENEHVN